MKDFFRGCLEEGITAAQPAVTKKAVAEALQTFLLLVSDELEDQEISKTEIRDRYDPALVQLIQDDSVKPILGKAFEKDCGAIAATELSTLWQHSTLRGQPFPFMPEDFDWQRVGREYLKKVRRIVRETPELRSLLETQLLEDIAHNTSQLSPGFDVAKYRDSLQCSYGHLKLYAIDSTDRVDAIKLWNMFIEQTVREALPPKRYELPLDLKRQLQQQGQLESDLSPDALDHYRQEYFQQPSRKVLEVINSVGVLPLRAVVLGDPGAGKSTLLQYLALAWVESQTSEFSKSSEVSKRLPLLIELREYAIAPVNNFLEFLHRGRGVDWQFDQQQLHQHLQDQPTLVMFDGLDEVFDRATQSAIIDDIIRFTQQYPQAQVLITSRIIGYNPDRLQQAKFRHFTIQPLNTDEIHEFIERWYMLALGNDPDKPRLVTRLKEAIANSTAIQNLADNPLLLTMMAILNRRQELPRDRADLYDQASRVLLYHWDVDHKRLQLPMDAIGRREKQEMLRLVAYEMQAGAEGLKGNLISAERLTQILTQYLRDQGFSESREKANGLIDQLRHRNWILCDRGADTYGFVHRTFLEYFCAIEIVHRFEKQRTLTFEQLRDEVFGQHWQDETWHEVLRLICGAIDPKFAGQLLEFLMSQEIEWNQVHSKKTPFGTFGKYVVYEPRVKNLLLAADCLAEINGRQAVFDVSNKLLLILQQEIEAEFSSPYFLAEDPALKVTHIIARCWYEDAQALDWLKNCVYRGSENSCISYCAVESIFQYRKHDLETLTWLKSLVTGSKTKAVDKVAKMIAIENIAKGWFLSPVIRLWILSLLKSEDWTERSGAVQALAQGWSSDEDTLIKLEFYLSKDIDWRVRASAIRALVEFYIHEPLALTLLSRSVVSDPFERESRNQLNPRSAALEALLTHYSNHPKTLELLRDRATNDPDEQLRQWAQKQLKKIEEG